MWLLLHFSWTALQSFTWLELEWSSRQQTCLTIPSPHPTPAGRGCVSRVPGSLVPSTGPVGVAYGESGLTDLVENWGPSWHTKSTSGWKSAWLPGSCAVWSGGEPTPGTLLQLEAVEGWDATQRDEHGCPQVHRLWSSSKPSTLTHTLCSLIIFSSPCSRPLCFWVAAFSSSRALTTSHL